ncbi:oocyte zinc finger protein XlCOF6-like isoform X3 [Phyllopteryx taeniolatus]|uniref:oocyte zinc finger protein XlCOF6-like isoform X3 n=1 Tax=Phyllopteryx taeniolatus TaxID=161469 RepID=UPI002AD564FB|nr:oocyte zinc finger protein XlCOF6-like isoform X3 [Phyllopteryx taeniolatus]
MADATTKKTRRVRSAEAKKRKRDLDRVRDRTRINIGHAFKGWRKLREGIGCKTDEELAFVLLDSYQKVTTRTSREFPLPTINEESNGYVCELQVSFLQGSLPSDIPEPLAVSADSTLPQPQSEEVIKSEPQDEHNIDEQLPEQNHQLSGPDDDSEFHTSRCLFPSNWTLAEEMSALKESQVTVRVCEELKMEPPLKDRRGERHNSHEEPYACPQCGKMSENKDSLKTHKCSEEKDSDAVSPAHDITEPQDNNPDCIPDLCVWDHKRLKISSEQCRSQNSKEENLSSDTPEPLSTFGDPLLLSKETKLKPGDECLQNSFKMEPPKSNQQRHGPKKIFDCPTCERLFPCNAALKRHVVIHTGKKPFKCFICGRGFTQRGNLNTHMKTIHKGESHWTLVEDKSPTEESSVSVHVCGECGMDFSLKDQLEEHRDIHKKPYACPDCSKSFKNKDSLKIHSRFHTGYSPFACVECGKTFITSCGLKQHELTHGGEKNYHCEQCGKAFLQASHLKVHLKIHSGERPHLCAICGKNYGRAETLKVHMRVHTGEKPYECDICGKSFCYFQGYRAHRMIHDKKPKPPTKPLGRPKQHIESPEGTTWTEGRHGCRFAANGYENSSRFIHPPPSSLSSSGNGSQSKRKPSQNLAINVKTFRMRSRWRLPRQTSRGADPRSSTVQPVGDYSQETVPSSAILLSTQGKYLSSASYAEEDSHRVETSKRT